jgi:hypothetical protein
MLVSSRSDELTELYFLRPTLQTMKLDLFSHLIETQCTVPILFRVTPGGALGYHLDMRILSSIKMFCND